MDFISELKWRGLVKDMVPGTEELLKQAPVVAYIGFDPTATSLHVGSLAQVMLLRLFQRCGHKPIVLVGGATGMVGDPSGKSEERNLLTEAEIRTNSEAMKKQLERFLEFGDAPTDAEMVNNYDWFQDIGLLDFLRDTGKHLTLNYMMAKESVKSRLETGISFTEFSYQLLQAYDFLWLNQNRNCQLQMGGSDQWGNITAGGELVRRMTGNEVFGLTIPLIKKADGGKFGKTEAGNIWLDPQMTSPYKFYQFWINASDDDAPNYLRAFTGISQEEAEALEADHAKAPHERLMQKAVAEEMTRLVHSEDALQSAIQASGILFGKSTKEQLQQLDETTLLDVFDGVPQFDVSKDALSAGLNVIELTAEKTQVFNSKGEARRSIKEGGLSINKQRVGGEDHAVSSNDLLNSKYLLVQRGKKNYYLVVAS